MDFNITNWISRPESVPYFPEEENNTIKQQADIVLAKTGQPTIESVAAIVCEYFNTDFEQLGRHTRKIEIVRARQWYHFIAKKFVPGASLNQIGRQFADKDHATVLHSIRVIECLCERYQKDQKVLYDLITRVSNTYNIPCRIQEPDKKKERMNFMASAKKITFQAHQELVNASMYIEPLLHGESKFQCYSVI